jgi:hypothetical protein
VHIVLFSCFSALFASMGSFVQAVVFVGGIKRDQRLALDGQHAGQKKKWSQACFRMYQLKIKFSMGWNVLCGMPFEKYLIFVSISWTASRGVNFDLENVPRPCHFKGASGAEKNTLGIIFLIGLGH